MHKSNILFLIIRSGSITGLLSSYNQKTGKEYFEIKKDIVFDVNHEYKSFDKETYKALEFVMETCVNKNLKLPLPDKVVCIYSSPWFDSQISEYDIPERKKGFSYKSLKDIVEDASNLDDDVVLIEQQIESVILNGYRTNNPEGQKYSEGSVTLLTSWITKDTKEGIEAVIHRVLSDREIQHMTLPHIVKAVTGSHNPSYHLLDIHGEATDIINVQDDNIDSTGSIPIGVHHLIRSVQKDNQEYHEAYEEFDHILRGVKDPIASREEKINIRMILSRWVDLLNKIPDFKENNNIVLISQNNTEKLFRDALQNSNRDYNIDIQILDKSNFSRGLDKGYKDLNITSLMIIDFWNKLDKKVVNIHRLQS